MADNSRLLLVDDEPRICEFVQRIAEEAGFSVIAASDAKSFEEAYVSCDPDVVALDLAMPQVDGIELLRFLAEYECRAKLLIISGFDRRVLETAWRLGEALGLKMAGMVEKPMRAASLRSLLIGLREGA